MQLHSNRDSGYLNWGILSTWRIHSTLIIIWVPTGRVYSSWFGMLNRRIESINPQNDI